MTAWHNKETGDDEMEIDTMDANDIGAWLLDVSLKLKYGTSEGIYAMLVLSSNTTECKYGHYCSP